MNKFPIFLLQFTFKCEPNAKHCDFSFFLTSSIIICISMYYIFYPLIFRFSLYNGIVEVHSVSHSFPMHGCKGSVWLDGSGKVGRQSRFGRIFLLRSVFKPKTLPLPATRLKSIRQRKQATDGKSEERREERLTDEAEF